MQASRREFLRRGVFLTAGSITAGALAHGQQTGQHVQETPGPSQEQPPARSPRLPGRPEQRPAGPEQRVSEGPAVSVETPDIPTLLPKIEDGVKVFNLVAEPVKRELIPGRVMDVWGYNGTCPGPTIQVTQGDRVRIILDNHLPEPTTIHWHGFEIPVEMDGTPYISQKPVPPGGRFVYEFTVHQEGTFFYHSHGEIGRAHV